MFKWLKRLFKGDIDNVSLEELYLSQSASLEDLERRQQQIARGNAPWHNYI